MPSDLVILLHGIMRSKIDMAPMAHFLRKNGYNTLNIAYPSRTKTLEDLADFIHDKITTCPKYTPQSTLHFVSHSMGGLITRYYIHKYIPKNIGRIVMLSPPNTGSELADMLNSHPLLSKPYKWLLGPAGAQLTTTYTHPTHTITYPTLIIAGTQSINPLALWALPKSKVGAHDGIVPVKRTELSGMSQHITMHVNHTFMMFSPTIMQKTLSFLIAL